MSAVNQFKSAFLALRGADRFQLIQQVKTANSGNAGVDNLVSNLDVNYQPLKDAAKEAAQRRKADNIHFVCQQLSAFPTFRYP